MFNRHDSHLPVLTASILCTALAVTAQEGNRGQDPTRPQPGQVMQGATKDKFATFEDVKGAKVYMKSPGSDLGAGQDRQLEARSGQGASGAGEEIGEVVDVVLKTSNDGINRLGQPGQSDGASAEAVVKVKSTSGQAGAGQTDQQRGMGGTNDRTVRVPLEMFEWDSNQKRLSFTRTRAEFDAMPVLIVTVTTIEPAPTPPGGVARGQDEQNERNRGQQQRDTTDRTGTTGRAGDQQQAMKLSKAANAKLESKNGEKLGKVEHIVLDMQQGDVSYVLASLEGKSSSGEYCVLPWRAIETESGHGKGGMDAAKQRGHQNDRGGNGDGNGNGNGDSRATQGSMTLTANVEKAKLENAPTIRANDLSKLAEPQFRQKMSEIYPASGHGTEQPGTGEPGRGQPGSGRPDSGKPGSGRGR